MIQSVVFKKSMWSQYNAELWLNSRGLVPIKKCHVTETTLRFRIVNPDMNTKYEIKNVDDGVVYIVPVSK